MKIDPQAFVEQGWKEHYSGYPADLFYGPGEKEPWENIPHLHLNYAIGGAMQSLTYKTNAGNSYLYHVNSGWDESVFKTIGDEKIKAQALFAKSYI